MTSGHQHQTMAHSRARDAAGTAFLYLRTHTRTPRHAPRTAAFPAANTASCHSRAYRIFIISSMTSHKTKTGICPEREQRVPLFARRSPNASYGGRRKAASGVLMSSGDSATRGVRREHGASKAANQDDGDAVRRQAANNRLQQEAWWRRRYQ